MEFKTEQDLLDKIVLDMKVCYSKLQYWHISGFLVCTQWQHYREIAGKGELSFARKNKHMSDLNSAGLYTVAEVDKCDY